MALILEIAIGAKPANLFNRLDQIRDGAEQVRLELTLLGRLLADDPSSYPVDLSGRLSGYKVSLAHGIAEMKPLEKEKSAEFQQLETTFRENFLPDFLNFVHPVGDQDRG